MDGKRRLPLIQEPRTSPGAASPAGALEGEDDAEVRAPWQWVGFGALAIFVVWLPLSAAVTALVVRLGGMPDAPVARALLFAGSLAVAALSGGYLVGRWGAAGVTAREAALAGLSAAIVATALSWGAVGVSVGALATVVFAVPPAALGGALGRKRRPRT